MKNKLIIVFSLVLLIILLPSDVFADSYSFWKVPYKNTNYNSYDGRNGYFGTYSSGLQLLPTYTTCAYFTDSSFSYYKGQFDRVEIPFSFAVYSSTNNLNSDFMTVPNADSLYYKYNNLNVQFEIVYSNSEYDATASCSVNLVGNYGQDLNGILDCPVNRVADGVRRVCTKYTFNNALSSSGTYDTYFGLNGWFNFIYNDDNSSSIVNAINNQTNSINNNQNNTTTAINNTTNAINGVNDSLTDSSGNSNTDNANAIQGFQNQVANNNTISSLITMPITLYQKILNSVNGSCSPFTLGQLLGTNVVFPCINPATYLGSSLWSIIDVIISGLLIFAISKKFINIFYEFTSMKDGKDEVGD